MDSYKVLCESLRKKYCVLYSCEVNKLLRKYFRDLIQVKEEPADIHPQFLKITQLIIEANQSQKGLQQAQTKPNAKQSAATRAGANQQLVKVPDLIVKNRKYNQMEIEMDKFLAKKNPVFKQDPNEKDSYGLGVNLTE